MGVGVGRVIQNLHVAVSTVGEACDEIRPTAYMTNDRKAELNGVV